MRNGISYSIVMLTARLVRSELTYFCSQNGAAEVAFDEQEYKDCGASCVCTATEILCYTPPFFDGGEFEFTA